MKLILAEKMFSHSTPSIPLDETYTDFSVEKLFEEYKKAIPELTIDDSERKQALLNKTLKEKSKLEDQNQKYSKLENDFYEFKQQMSTFIDQMEKKKDNLE